MTPGLTTDFRMLSPSPSGRGIKGEGQSGSSLSSSSHLCVENRLWVSSLVIRHSSPWVALVVCLAAAHLSAAEFPETQWPTATPAELGLDAEKLNQARD